MNSNEEAANLLAEAMAEIQQMLKPILEATNGYRQSLIRAGWDDRQAQQMAADYHGGMLRMVVK